MKAKRRREEDQIQRSILAFVAAVVVAPHKLFHVPNGGLRTRAEAGILKGLGVLAGIPDLVLQMPEGRAYYFEVKAPDGDLEDSQRDMLEDFRKMNVPWAVVRSIDDVRKALLHWKIETREAKA